MPGKDEIDFQLLAENSIDIIWNIGLDGGIRYVSPSIFQLLGWKPEETTEKVYGEFVYEEDLPVLAAVVASASASGAQDSSATLRMKRKDGSPVWMETNARMVREAGTGEPREYVLIMRDITERKALEDKLAALAQTDGLTGISNRRAFDEDLEREWKRTLREGSQVSLLLLDIDHFKHFNDQYGHQVGDDCLRAVAAAVSESVRATDIVARYGGDEITVILPATDSAGAVDVAEKIRSAVDALRITYAGDEGDLEGEGRVAVSIGAATALARNGGTMRMPESLLLAADHALYKSKHEGRNRVATALLLAPKDR